MLGRKRSHGPQTHHNRDVEGISNRCQIMHTFPSSAL